MSRQAFRQIDIARSVKGAQSAGLSIGRIEIDRDGKIVLIPAPEGKLPIPERNDLDRELEEFEARHGEG